MKRMRLQAAILPRSCTCAAETPKSNPLASRAQRAVQRTAEVRVVLWRLPVEPGEAVARRIAPVAPLRRTLLQVHPWAASLGIGVRCRSRRRLRVVVRQVLREAVQNRGSESVVRLPRRRTSVPLAGLPFESIDIALAPVFLSGMGSPHEEVSGRRSWRICPRRQAGGGSTLRMLMNNLCLCREFAERPHELVVHAGVSRASPDWMVFDAIASLRSGSRASRWVGGRISHARTRAWTTTHACADRQRQSCRRWPSARSAR